MNTVPADSLTTGWRDRPRRRRVVNISIMARNSFWVRRRHRFSPADLERRPEPWLEMRA